MAEPAQSANNNLNEPPGISFEEAQAVNAEPHSAPDMRAVTTWKPEDTANFLAAAIREAQRPYTEAIKRRGVPTGIVTMLILVFLVFIAGLFYLIFNIDLKLEKANEAAAEAIASAKNAEVEGAVKRIPLLTELEELKLKVEREAMRAVKAEEKAEASHRENLEIQEALAQERLNHEQTELLLKKALEEVEDLSLKIAILEEEQARVKEAKDLIAAASEAAEKERQAAVLLQKQLDAQAEAETAMRKQLEAAREMIKALQKENDPGREEQGYYEE
ncbi:MAG: hypothetical protein JXA52_09005 [Planctomycetes bacterium]|nr:hypothetical protein [Planctomycetota bacterium]